MSLHQEQSETIYRLLRGFLRDIWEKHPEFTRPGDTEDFIPKFKLKYSILREQMRLVRDGTIPMKSKTWLTIFTLQEKSKWAERIINQAADVMLGLATAAFASRITSAGGKTQWIVSRVSESETGEQLIHIQTNKEAYAMPVADAASLAKGINDAINYRPEK